MSEITNNTSYNKPVITLVLLAYNQDKYIGEAVASAFAQTYSPLEIILSDDCSSDDTYKIMERMVQNYHGTHSVILNKTPANLGLTGHVNQLLEMASGEFIVMAGGDDISEKERVQEISDIWLNSNKTVNAIFSNLEKIDAKGNTLGPMFSSKPVFAQTLTDFKAGIKCWVVGASFSFASKVYNKYGRIDPRIRQEDGCLAFRSLLEGDIVFVDKKLVKYRHHGENLSQTHDPKRRLHLQKNEYYLKKGWLNDAQIHIKKDPILATHLKWEFKKAYLRSVLFKLPLLGYLYNYFRIKTKLFLIRLSILN